MKVALARTQSEYEAACPGASFPIIGLGGSRRIEFSAAKEIGPSVRKTPLGRASGSALSDKEALGFPKRLTCQFVVSRLVPHSSVVHER